MNECEQSRGGIVGWPYIVGTIEQVN